MMFVKSRELSYAKLAIVGSILVTYLATFILIEHGADAISCFVCHPSNDTSGCNEAPWPRHDNCAVCSRMRIVIKGDKSLNYEEPYAEGTLHRYNRGARGLYTTRLCIPQISLEKSKTLQFMLERHSDVCARDRKLFLHFVDDTYGFLSHIFYDGGDEKIARNMYEIAKKTREEMEKMPPEVQFEVCSNIALSLDVFRSGSFKLSRTAQNIENEAERYPGTLSRTVRAALIGEVALAAEVILSGNTSTNCSQNPKKSLRISGTVR